MEYSLFSVRFGRRIAAGFGTVFAHGLHLFQNHGLPVRNLLFCVLLGDAVQLLNLSCHLLALACDDVQLVVRQLAPLLFGVAFELFPVAFNAIPVNGVSFSWLSLKMNVECLKREARPAHSP